MLTVGILLLSATIVCGFYEISVNEAESPVGQQNAAGMESMHECVTHLFQILYKEESYVTSTSIEDIMALVQAKGYAFRGVVGKVAAKKTGCECQDGTELIPAHLMTKVGTVDYYLTSDQQEIEFYLQRGYTDRGINFWCSPEKDKCGASLPLYRHTSHPSLSFSHVFNTKKEQNDSWDIAGWKKDGIVCYIWPKQFIAHDYAG